MFLQLSLLHFILFLPQLSSSAFPIAKPSCPDRCGDLSIPYPFGIGSNCSLGPSFDFGCNESTTPPKPYLPALANSEVTELSPTKIRAKFLNLALSSYTTQDRRPYTVIYNLIGTQYTFSYENWVTAIGCDDALAVTGQANRSFAGGCIAYCQDRGDSGGIASCPDEDNGYALGIGCCRTPVPKGTTNLVVNLTDVSGNWGRSKLYPSSYAFVGEKSGESVFSYYLKDLDNSTSVFFQDNWSAKNTPPVLFDWRIGSESCDQARRNSSIFACQDNSFCIDFDAGVGGYLCNCTDGYEGNPYLSPGCQDIDECLYACDSNSDCTNTPGSFKCSCRNGYYGDGTKNGTGCNPLPPSKTIVNIAIGLGSGLGSLLLLSICFWLHKVIQKRKKVQHKEKLFKHLLLQQQTNDETLWRTKLFPAKELDKATDHFNENRVLGQGGQGVVYKGMLSDGKIVAIKKLKQVDEEQLEQFINEVAILSQINHRNVVKLFGCCLATEVPLLVYEFVPNGTLYHLIHDPNPEFPFSWNMRLKMASDIAGALAYLHSSCSIPIYHRDIKSSNVLLDEKFVVKIADFGSSKSVALDQTHLTTMVKGTFGYLDPEYFQSSQFTDKSDVYSFGVVLAELLTGKKPISMERTEERRNLAMLFLASMEAKTLDAILDARVLEEGRKEDVIAVAKVAQRCLNFEGKMRPTMKEVATELASFKISETTLTAKHDSEEGRIYEAKPMMIPDSEYTWTGSSYSAASSSSADTHPFMSRKN